MNMTVKVQIQRDFVIAIAENCLIHYVSVWLAETSKIAMQFVMIAIVIAQMDITIPYVFSPAFRNFVEKAVLSTKITDIYPCYNS